MKICFTSYYGLRDSLLCAANALIRLGYTVNDYQLLHNMKTKENYVHDIINFINDNQIDIILWWFINIKTDDMDYIVKNTKCINIYFNWDEPYNWVHCDIASKAKLWDIVFVCSEEKLADYIKYGTKKAIWLLPGYDPIINCLLKNDDIANKYDCDISFICTNLYENTDEYPDQIFERKKLVDELYKSHTENKFIFHIYGPKFLETIYPLAYRGYITYDNQNLLFNKSKINLCTHVNNKYKYLNERCIMIAGSGGLLLVDNIKGINEILDENSYIVIENNISQQVLSILDNYDKYIDKRLKLLCCSVQYTWDKWAETIHNNLDVLYNNKK